MCLRFLWSEKEKDKWLKDKPDTIIAYKVVVVNTMSHTLWPPVFCNSPYKETNRLEERPLKWPLVHSIYGKTRKSRSPTKYIAGYHLFTTKYGAQKWAKDRGNTIGSSRECVLKCLIPKEQVLFVGKQNECMVIVSKEFSFAEGIDPFEEADKNQVKRDKARCA